MRLGHSWGIFAHIKAETVDLQRSQMCGKQDLNCPELKNSPQQCNIRQNFQPISATQSNEKQHKTTPLRVWRNLVK